MLGQTESCLATTDDGIRQGKTNIDIGWRQAQPEPRRNLPHIARGYPCLSLESVRARGVIRYLGSFTGRPQSVWGSSTIADGLTDQRKALALSDFLHGSFLYVQKQKVRLGRKAHMVSNDRLASARTL